MVIGSFITTICPLMHRFLHRSRLMQRFLAKHQITEVTQAPYSQDLVPCDLLSFPKTKITFERKEISDHWWDSGNYSRAADGDWVNCVRSQGAYFEGDWGIIVLCTVFLISCIFFNKRVYNTCYNLFLITAILPSVRCHFIVTLICISLMINDVEQLFMFLLGTPQFFTIEFDVGIFFITVWKWS